MQQKRTMLDPLGFLICLYSIEERQVKSDTIIVFMLGGGGEVTFICPLYNIFS